jgi:hypothetical protein
VPYLKLDAIPVVMRQVPGVSMSQLDLHGSPDQFSTNEYLYHYTSLDALLSILASDCLWASDLESTNDPAELVHIRELGEQLCLVQAIPDLFEGFDPPIPPEQTVDVPAWVYQHFVSGILERFNKEGARRWKTTVGRMFSVSFCRKGDLLSQWRGYGLTGCGVCIGFDQKLLSSDFGPQVELAKIEYAPEIQRNRIQSFIMRAFRDYCKAMDGVPIEFSIHRNGPDDIAIETGFSSLIADMAKIAHTFKRPGFSEEEEYRAIKRLPKESDGLDEVNLRVKGNSLIPYVALHARNGKLPIREIIQGPAYGSDSADYALVALMERKGHSDVKISKSKYSLR